METTVAAQTQGHGGTDRQVMGQPAGSDAQGAVGMLFLAHDQLQRAVAGQGSDGVLAHRQADQCLHQRLRLQANQMLERTRQQAPRQRLAQRLALAVQFDLGIAV
ncbi:hypothetical protein D9M73_238350 [compost metagenome]